MSGWVMLLMLGAPFGEPTYWFSGLDGAPEYSEARSIASLCAFASRICAFSTSRSTSVRCAFRKTFFTKLIMNTLHFMSTSSRNQRPSFGMPTPSSWTVFGSPGKEPPRDHLLLILRPMGAKQWVCMPVGRLWKQPV